MTRRDWLKRIIAVPIAAAVGAKLAPTLLRDAGVEGTGIAIKFAQRWDIARDRRPHRIDVWLATSEPGMQRWSGEAIDWALVNGCMFQETISLAEYRASGSRHKEARRMDINPYVLLALLGFGLAYGAVEAVRAPVKAAVVKVEKGAKKAGHGFVHVVTLGKK